MNPAFLVLIACSVFLSACAQLSLLAVNLPGDGPSHAGLVFDQKRDLALDIYGASQKSVSKPVIVFLYGGRWSNGGREDYKFVGSALSQAGYHVVIPDYRKYPAVKFPAFVEDGAEALAWVYRNIALYGGDPDQIFLMGHSAGAHIAALLVTDKKYLQAKGLSRNIIKAFAGLAGPYAFTPDEPDLIDMFGPPENYPQMQATSFIDGAEPPMLLLYGEKDKSVKSYNHEKLQKRIEDKGGRVQTILYPGVSHVALVGAFSWAFDAENKVRGDVLTFFESSR